MLAAPTEYPFAGSQAFLRPTAEPCRIIRHNLGQGTVLISLTGSRDASGTRTVAFSEIAGTPDAAQRRARRPRRSKSR